MPTDTEQRGIAVFRAEMRENTRTLQEQHYTILARLGELVSIKEDVSELKKDVQGLLDLKKQGIGFLAAITLTGGILLLGLKSWIAAMAATFKG